MPRTIFENIVIQRYTEQLSFGFCEYTNIRFFEILFIEKGRGGLIINGHRMSYCENQLFIFVPDDKYIITVEEPTTVSTVKFLKTLFSNSSNSQYLVDLKNWFKKIETILHSANRSSNIKLNSQNEETNIQSLFNIICTEFIDNELRSDLVITNTLNSILHIVSRNVGNVSLKTSSSKIQDMINYIHSHIYQADLISNKSLANTFNISDSYISQYFKKQMGISIKKYILNLKIKLAETQLQYTDLTLSEIAYDLGFTDSSHLEKTFISFKGVTAGAYRQESQTMN